MEFLGDSERELIGGVGGFLEISMGFLEHRYGGFEGIPMELLWGQ